jgi:hypothetical protein
MKNTEREFFSSWLVVLSVLGLDDGKHVPENPWSVVENMTGAGGIIQANYMFQRANKPG